MFSFPGSVQKRFPMDRSETFSTPDVASLSQAKRRLLEKYLHEGAVPTAASMEVINPRPSGEPAPLSFSQEQLWLRERSTHGIPPLYNECITLRMAGPLDRSGGPALTPATDSLFNSSTRTGMKPACCLSICEACPPVPDARRKPSGW